VAKGTLVIESPLADIMLEGWILDSLEDTCASGDGLFFFGSFALSKILLDISEASIFVFDDQWNKMGASALRA
jgi:hypothetical protein